MGTYYGITEASENERNIPQKHINWKMVSKKCSRAIHNCYAKRIQTYPPVKKRVK